MAIIYKIEPNIKANNNDVYYGSTKLSLNTRFNLHKSAYQQYLKDNKRYISSIELFKRYNINQLTIKYLDESVNDYKKIEGDYIKNNPCINNNIANRSIIEYKEQNREILNEKKRELKNCNCGCKITTSNFNRHVNTSKHKIILLIKILFLYFFIILKF